MPTGFRDYALDTASKCQPGSADHLRANRFRMFERAFRPISTSISVARSIIDIGCGSGDLLLYLHSRTAAELVGFDPSMSQLQLAHQLCAGSERISIVSDLTPIDRRFDLVFAIHVIEHIPDIDLDRFVRDLARLTTDDGRIIIATPNGLNPFAYAYFMSTDRTHLRMHSPFTLNEIFRSHGFQVEQVHRELPQAYDLMSLLKTLAWSATSLPLKLALYATAAGVRGLRFPLTTAPSFYAVLGRILT